jgi:hypothetical protein
MKRQLRLSPEFIEDMLEHMSKADLSGFTEGPHGKIMIEIEDENYKTVKEVTLSKCWRNFDGVYHLEWEA